MKCPVRGKCCHVALPIREHQVILEHVACPHLDMVSGFCKDYENRDKYPWCLTEKDMFKDGGLPKGCLYLKKYPEREIKSAEFILDVIEGMELEAQQEIVGIYNHYNN